MFSLNRLNKLCWSKTEHKTEGKWTTKNHELKLITRLEGLEIQCMLLVNIKLQLNLNNSEVMN